jgi:hypothetical protein
MGRVHHGSPERGGSGSGDLGIAAKPPETEMATEEIRVLIGYLRNNSHRIDYKAFKRGQYPRGSGGVESANKFICHVRMKRSGA